MEKALESFSSTLSFMYTVCILPMLGFKLNTRRWNFDAPSFAISMACYNLDL